MASHLPGNCNVIADEKIEDRSQLQGLDAAAEQVKTAVEYLAGTDRSVCVGMERSAPQFREFAAATRGVGDQRLRLELERVSRICFSPIRSYSSLLSENKERESRSRSSVFSMAISTLVSPPVANVDQISSGSSSASSLVTLINARPTPINTVKEIPSSLVKVIRRRFENKGFSKETVVLLMESVLVYTTASYKSAWRNWVNWNHKRFRIPCLLL